MAHALPGERSGYHMLYASSEGIFPLSSRERAGVRAVSEPCAGPTTSDEVVRLPHAHRSRGQFLTQCPKMYLLLSASKRYLCP